MQTKVRDSKEAAPVSSSMASPAKSSKSGVEKTQSYLSVASTSIGIVGAIGTVFVYLASTYCTGEVEIHPDKPVTQVMVKVTDSKGQQKTYYTRYVSLMPGNYHLEYGVADKTPTKHADAQVNLWQRTIIPYTVPEELAVKEEQPEPDKKWWQVWKRAKKSENNTK